MKKPESHIEHLRLEEIRAYIENKLGNEAMFRVERHLLDCQLCQEAMEGIEEQNIENVLSDVEVLKRRLLNKIQPEQRTNTFFRYRYYGIAASAIVLIASIFFIFDFGQPARENQVAQNEEMLEKEDLAVKDKGGSVTDQTAEKRNTLPTVSSEVNDQTPANSAPDDTEAAGSGLERVDEEPDQLAGSERPSVLAELDAAGEEVESETRDMNFDVAEDVTEQKENTAGNRADADNISQERALSTPLEPAPQAITSSQEDLKKKLNSQGALARRKEAIRSGPGQLQIRDDSEPQPVGGWNAYSKYLTDNLTFPSQAIAANIEGTVEVKAIINESGRPENLEVVKSLGYGCDEEALRLITEGPDWDPVKSDKSDKEKEVLIKVEFRP